MNDFEYTCFQKNLLRRELLLLHDFGTDQSIGKITWPQVIDEIATYSSLPLVDPDPVLESNYVHVQNGKLTPRGTKFFSEKIRNFVCSPNKKTPKSGVSIDDLIPFIIEYLLHPDISKLTPLQLADPDIALDAGARLAKYIWDGLDNCAGNLIQETYSALSSFEGQINTTYFSFEKTFHPCLFSVAETKIVESTVQSINHGWAVNLPDNCISIYLKKIQDNKCVRYEGHFYPAKINLINQQTIEILSQSANEKPIHISKVEIFTEFSYNKNGTTFNTNSINIDREPNNLSLSGGVVKQIHSMTKDNTGELLITAIESMDLISFERLVNEGADVNYCSPQNGLTPLHLIAWLSRREELRIISKRQDLDYLVKDNNGRDPVELAINSRGDPVILRFLSAKRSKQLWSDRLINPDDPELTP